MFLFNKRCFFAYISCTVICLFNSYNSAFLTDVLRDEKGIPEQYNGFILALPCFTYAVSSFFVSIVMRRFPRRLFILVSFMLLSFALLMQGPSDLLNFPENKGLVISGLGLAGLA
jgi:cyanate permease